MTSPNPLVTRAVDQALAVQLVAQMQAPESPDPVRDLPPEALYPLAHTLVIVARRTGWAPTKEMEA